MHADAADGSSSGQSRSRAAQTHVHKHTFINHLISNHALHLQIRRTLPARCRLAMVRTRRSEDLQCGDGRLANSPCPPSAASCASCAAWDAEPQAPEEFPSTSMDQDHEAELALMQLRETRDAPAHNWLVPEGHQKVLSAIHRRFLVAWLSRVSSSSCLTLSVLFVQFLASPAVFKSLRRLRRPQHWPKQVVPATNALTHSRSLQACEAHHFALGTLALAVRLLDRFLQRTAVRQEDAWLVQLTAVACLSIAAKFEEVNPPYCVAHFQVCSRVAGSGPQLHPCQPAPVA